MVLFRLADNIGITLKKKVKLLDLDTLCKSGELVEPCGTRGFAAPEIHQALNTGKKVKVATSFDVFSFGRTIKNLLTEKVCIDDKIFHSFLCVCTLYS